MIRKKVVDTHAHLCDRVFRMDRAIVISNARNKGVSTIISVSETMADCKRNLELADIHSEILPAAGLYPAILDTDQAEEVIALIEKKRDALVAIGEVGLDYRVVTEESEKEIQRKIFGDFIDLSLEMELPLNVHSRSAGRYAIELLLERDARKVQLHAFDGKASSALPALEAGYFFSIPPSIVHSKQKQKLVRQLPLSSILLETDSPVLGPSPDERNEPANIELSITAIADIKNVSREEVTEATMNNTVRLYGDQGVFKSSVF
ncbi:MAG: TatD family hydrolase [Proteobacteria bacterium]|nr:TatD family hydrolase [Pseudomonadota bacterium]